MVEVTQADREAAAELIESYWLGTGIEHEQMQRLAQSYRAGHTQGVWADAFARHRIAALEEAARICEQEAETEMDTCCKLACECCAAAIRALIGDANQPSAAH